MCSAPIRGVDSIGISKTNHKLGLSGLGYGKIDLIHKTSITKSAITDQARLSHINTGNLDSQDSQQALNLSLVMTLLIKRSTMAVFWIKLLMIDKVIL